jgi:hypothetical protein
MLLLNSTTYSQNSVSISNSTNVSLDITPPFNPGSPIEIVSDASKWLNYSIQVTPPEPTYSISVEISSGLIPEGMNVYLEAAPYSGFGGGQPGIPTGRITLSNQPQVLIRNIGTCNSGSGTMVGHRLTYSLVITNYSLLGASSPLLNLIYTITQ